MSDTIGSAKIPADMKDKIKNQLEDSPGSKVVSLDDMVTFEVAYPKEYAKTKHFTNGDKVRLHRVTADQFEGKIGKIVS